MCASERSERALKKLRIFFSLLHISLCTMIFKRYNQNLWGPFLWGPLGSCPLCPLLNPALTARALLQGIWTRVSFHHARATRRFVLKSQKSSFPPTFQDCLRHWLWHAPPPPGGVLPYVGKTGSRCYNFHVFKHIMQMKRARLIIFSIRQD